MQIKTITCHDVNNYGASLQAYALQRFLQKKGYDVEIIDYLPIYKSDRLNFFECNRTTGRIYSLLKILPFLKPLVGLIDHLKVPGHITDYKFIKRKKPFNLFKKNKLKCTRQTYRTLKDLQQNIPLADIYIAGSDQIWNSVGANGRDPSYYCAFAPKNTKCISYAASFGAFYIPQNQNDFVSRQLSRFSAISTREHSGVEIVEKLGYQAQEVLDPVFLLDKDEWETLCSNIHKKEKYLLVYDLDMNHPGVKRLCLELAKRNHWKIYSINDFRICPYADYNINDAGPIEFIEWIRDAQFVVCTSFHGTAFSMIFHKQFYTFPLYHGKNHARMVDFLHKMHLDSHFVREQIAYSDLDSIDFKVVDDLLAQYKRNSREWLLSKLNQ